MARAELVGGGQLDGTVFIVAYVQTPPDVILVPLLDTGALRYIDKDEAIYPTTPSKTAEFIFTGRSNEEGNLLYNFKGYK